MAADPDNSMYDNEIKGKQITYGQLKATSDSMTSERYGNEEGHFGEAINE